MSENSVNPIEKITKSIDLVLWMANQYLTHVADSNNMTVEQALAAAELKHAEAESKLQKLKNLGHQ